MNILIIGNKYAEENTEEYYAQYSDFFKLAAQTDDTVNYALIDDLVISVGDGEFSIFEARSQKDLKDYQLILMLGSGFKKYIDVMKTVSSYAKLHDIPAVNDHSGYRSGSKLQQAVQFHEAGLSIAKTVYVTMAALSQKELGLDFPCIMKATIAAHGNDNYLVNDIDEARAIAAKSDKTFVLQRYLPNDGDYRILLIGSEHLIIKRAALESSHLNNTSQGGSASLPPADEVPESILAGARNISKALGMTYAGVDVLRDKNTGEFYFLEVNPQPQLMNGAFVEEKQQLVKRYLASLQAA